MDGDKSRYSGQGCDQSSRENINTAISDAITGMDAHLIFISLMLPDQG